MNRNLSFFTTGYSYMIQLIPVLIVAPLFIQRQVEFGVIGQSAMAFATLLGAFSLVITQFQAISTYASVVSRLGEFVEATEKLAARQELNRIGIASGADHFARIHELLEQLGLTAVVRPHESPATLRNWLDVFSFQEEKLMAVARAVLAKPRFAFIDELEAALDEAGRKRVLDLLTANGITCVTFGCLPPDAAYHGAGLELHDDGSWAWAFTS